MQRQWESKMEIYKLVFKQVQPIHIGAGSYGVISETRIFIPGWTMWGALTKAYNLQNGKDLAANQDLFENISCFYPSFDKEGNDVLFPKFKKGDFYLGKYSEKEFRAKFVDTNVSTAILPISRAAKDESLHETDVILPGVKKDYEERSYEKQLYWVGIVGFEDDEEVKNFLQEGLKIYVGGDSRYGLGLMMLIKSDKVKKEDVKNFVVSSYRYFDPDNKVNEITGKLELLVKATGYEGVELKVNKKVYYLIPNVNIADKIDIENLFPQKGILEKIINS